MYVAWGTERNAKQTHTHKAYTKNQPQFNWRNKQKLQIAEVKVNAKFLQIQSIFQDLC